MESVRIIMEESIRIMDSINVFRDATDPLGSIEYDMQGHALFYALQS